MAQQIFLNNVPKLEGNEPRIVLTYSRKEQGFKIDLENLHDGDQFFLREMLKAAAKIMTTEKFMSHVLIAILQSKLKK